MAERSWYAERIAQMASSQSTFSNPRPDYALSAVTGVTPMPDAQFRTMRNAVQFDAEQEELAARNREAMQKGLASLQNFFYRISRATEERDAEPSFTWFDTFNQDDDKTAWEDFKQDAGAVGRGASKLFSTVFGNLSGDSDFSRTVDEGGLQGEDSVAADQEHQNVQAVKDAGGVAMNALQTADRGVNAFVNMGNISSEQDLTGWEALTSGDAWAEAWDRADPEGLNVTAGRAAMDALWLGDDERVAAYEAGVDEAGRPVDQAYRRLREENTWYNVTSGTVDFTKTWFADPLVVVGKAGTAARAWHKGDLDRMGPMSRRRFTEILTAPDAALDAVRPKPWDVVGRRAMQVRKEQDGLRDRIRSGEIDAHWLSQNVQAFQQSPMAAEAFRRGAQVPRVGGAADEFDDDAFRVVVGALMDDTSVPARSILENDSRYRHARDAITAENEGGRLRQLELEIDEAEELLARYEGREALPWSPVYQKLQNAERDLPKMRLDADALKAQLAEYTEHEKWWNGLLQSAREGSTTMAAREGSSFGETFWGTFKPNNASTKQHRVVGATKTAFMRRPGVANLHDGNQYVTSIDRYFDSLEMRLRATDNGAGAMDDIARENGFTDFADMRRTTMNDALATTLDTDRRRLAAKVEDIALEGLYRKHGISEENAKALAAEFKGYKGRVFDDLAKKHEENDALRASGQAVDDGVPEGFSSYAVAEGDTVTEHLLPLSATELKNTSVLTDLQAMDQFLSRHGQSLDGLMGNMRARGGDLAEVATEAFAFYTRLWKPAVLFRFGYAIRNVTDEFLRAVAVAGQFPTVIGDSLGAGVRGGGRVAAKGVNRAARRAAKMTRFSGRKARRVAEGKEDLLPVPAEYGSKGTRVRGHQVPGLYEPGAGDVFRAENASASAYQHFARQQERTLTAMRTEHMTHTLANRNEKHFVKAWKDRLEKHIATDPIDRMMLDGVVRGADNEATDAAIKRWLRGTAEGREMRRRMRHAGETEDWVAARRQRFEESVPDEATASRLLNEKTVDEADLRKIMADRPHRVPQQIDAATDAYITGESVIGRNFNKLVDRGYHLLGSLPVDTLVRHPFANHQYRHMMRRQIDALPEGATISDKMMKEMADTARRYSVKQTRRYMFSMLDSDTGLTHFMRFMSPFMSAWQESLTKWARIMMERPEAFARIWVNGWNDTHELYGVEQVTEDGLTAEQEAQLAAEQGRAEKPVDTIRLPLLGRTLKELDFMLPGDGAAASEIFEHVQFNKNNANVITQGSYWYLPGFGPIVQAPLQAALGGNPEWQTEEGVKKFLWDWAIAPVGKQDAMDHLVPSSILREAHAFMSGPEANDKFRTLQVQTYQRMFSDWVAEGRTPGEKPTQAEATNVAKSVMAFNVLARIGTPAVYQAIPSGETASGHSGQFLIDNARLYQNLYGWEEGPTKFMEDFGEDAYMYTTSMSDSKNALPPTGKAWRGWKRFEGEIGEAPEVALAIVGMDSQDDEFNLAVYQETLGLGQRGKLDPAGWQDKAEREQGWRKYREWKNAVDVELAARGMSTLNNSGAEDLRYANFLRIQDLRAQFPGWGADYDEYDRGKGYRTVESFRRVVERGEGDFLERPDWKYGVTRYLEIHDMFTRELDARRAAGMSADLQSGDNADLRAAWDMAMGELVQGNPMFADIYHRFLGNHVPDQGSYAARLPEEVE